MDSPKHARTRAGRAPGFGSTAKSRITRSASSREDEGIVQSAAKAAGELSPRLHQQGVPGNRAGNAIFSVMSQAVRTLNDREAAYIAGVVDGEGTVSLVRHHRG